MNKQELSAKLIDHYQCFNSERFYLDEYNEDMKFVSIVTSSISDSCPVLLCRYIAKYIYKLCKDMRWIYVGAWAFNTKPWRKNE